MKLDAEFVTWAYRILLEREPESVEVVERIVAKNLTPIEYVRNVLTCEEFSRKHIIETRISEAWCWAEVETLLLRVNLMDLYISWPVIENTFDRIETKYVHSVLKRGDYAMDIGANLGYYTILFASIVGAPGRVYSFEPMPHLYDSLMKSIQRNGLSSRVFSFNAALSETRGELEMFHAPGSRNWGGASLLADREAPPGHEVIKVTAGALSDFVVPKRLDFVKIDVEGAEPQVIRGSMDVFSKYKPIVLSEIHVPLLKAVSNHTADDYVNLMESLGYSCRLLDNTGDIGAPIDTGAIGAVANVVFVPK